MSALASDPEETTQWEQARPRHITPDQWKTLQSMHPPHGMRKFRQQEPGGAPQPPQ